MAAEPKNEWEIADRVSDRIVGILNDEKERPGFSPVQAVAGQCLALLSILDTAPAPRPPEIDELFRAANAYLAKAQPGTSAPS
jgi:hypothetical protein